MHFDIPCNLFLTIIHLFKNVTPLEFSALTYKAQRKVARSGSCTTTFHKVTSNLTAGLPIKSLLSSTCCLRLSTFLLFAEVVLQFLFDIYSSVVGCTSGVR